MFVALWLSLEGLKDGFGYLSWVVGAAIKPKIFSSIPLLLRLNVTVYSNSAVPVWTNTLALISEFANLLSVFCALHRQYPTVFSQNFHTYYFLYIINEFPLKH